MLLKMTSTSNLFTNIQYYDTATKQREGVRNEQDCSDYRVRQE
jgi:hypothetical protein